MEVNMIYKFNGSEVPKLNQVGGKAKALIETTLAGFPVPEGIALSVEFFDSWLTQIKSSDQWHKMLEDTSKENCDLIVSNAKKMTFSDQMKDNFLLEMKSLKGDIFAVRSSSPEEDLEGTSFAGMYETLLGQRRDQLEKAVAEAFSSCFDYRVITYKKQHNMELNATSIAVVVQRQIASDVSGVGFSLNPLNNCFDEIMINASFGLGEAIVSGIVTPDTYLVDSVEYKIMNKKIGDKKIGLWLDVNSGVFERENENAEDPALSDAQIIELSKLIKKCEKHYDKPMDTEWTYENGHLYLLQSRPITTHYPMFKELLTEPGKNKRFYIDLMVLTQGFAEPMSVLGLELWANMLEEIKMRMMTPYANGSVPAIYGKEYFSITAFQKVVGKKAGLKFINSYDGNLKKIFDHIDLDQHGFEGKVEGTDQTKKIMFKSIMKMLPSMFKGAYGDYEKAVKDYINISDKVLLETEKLTNEGDFSKLSKDALTIMNEVMGTAPVMIAGMISNAKMAKIFKDEDVVKELAAMNMDLDGNPTSEMGHLLLDMASEDAFKNIASRAQFVEKAENRGFTDSFLNLYDEFMKKFSARGFKEIDVASKRIYEDLGMLYDKLIEINIEDNHMHSVLSKRQEAYDKLLAVAKKIGKEKKFIDAAARMKATFGYREHPKYLIVVIMAKLHDICLEIADEWVEQGRIDQSYDIFDLTSENIDQAQSDKSFDIRDAIKHNLSGYIKSNDWPLVIDSRGKIYKAKLEVNDGDYVGDAIAPGKVTGRAKVLYTPYEKPLNSGEILVAKFTEPSWTPIFTNAAGVVMEIGGPLQHGGIIAREYGIPCVSGLMGIMGIIKDGDLLEVDGYNGVVRIIESSGENN
jgi:phosphohistidine swiveling domain-containing protein